MSCLPHALCASVTKASWRQSELHLALPVMEATRLSIAEDIIHEGTTTRDEKVLSINEDPYVNETSVITSAAGEEVMSTDEDPYANETSSISSAADVACEAAFRCMLSFQRPQVLEESAIDDPDPSDSIIEDRPVTYEIVKGGTA